MKYEFVAIKEVVEERDLTEDKRENLARAMRHSCGRARKGVSKLLSPDEVRRSGKVWLIDREAAKRAWPRKGGQ